MKTLLIAAMALGTLSVFAGKNECDKAIAQTQHISNSIAKWDYKLQRDIADYKYTETIELSQLKRDTAVELFELSKAVTKAICSL